MGPPEDPSKPAPDAGGVRGYVRPVLPAATYYSPDGEPIAYGQRWGQDGPPPDSYSVLSHPERFGGLHDVARALISHLEETYDVEVDDSTSSSTDLLRQPDGVVHSVRVTPRKPGAATMTFALMQPPGVIVHAGILHDFSFPPCGCDACDETVESAADRLEMLVLAVAAGGYGERYPIGWRRWLGYSLTSADGSATESGEGDPGSIAADRLRSAKARLRD